MLSSVTPARAQILPSEFCPMAHCDPQMSDQLGVNQLPPLGPVTLAFEDTLRSGSGPGLGCSSNGTMVVCSYFRDPMADNLVAYHHTGTAFAIKWSKDIGFGAQSSAPLVTAAGDVIAASTDKACRFDIAGTPMWGLDGCIDLPNGGTPISPVILQDGSNRILLGTRAQGTSAPIYVLEFGDGTVVGNLQITDLSGNFETRNTPGVSGSRAYLMMSRIGNNLNSRLVAVDVDPSGVVTEAWTYKQGFAGENGASPIVIELGMNPPVGNRIIFDADRACQPCALKPRVIAVDDTGVDGQFGWNTFMPTGPDLEGVRASVALDPRQPGCVWTFVKEDKTILCLDVGNGLEDFRIDVDFLFGATGGTQVPSSAMSIGGGMSDAVLLVSVKTRTNDAGENKAWILAVDLVPEATQRWTFLLGDSSQKSNGQFPLIQDSSGNNVVVFSPQISGARFLAQQP